jgi:predicted alpha/beta hydrolase
MGKYDIPAIISHVLTTTGHPSLFYIGHSLGNAMLMIAASCNPKLIEKVKLFIAFAPAVYLHMTEAKMISVPAAFSQKQKV